uniref:GTPase IMAP family member 4-like n=1 Tax=Gouania willdenowi TaxID=441366 RepID=A0A8C5GIB5_GOUWI
FLQNSNCSPEMRIVLLGKCGSGKSSLGNTLLGEKVFNVSRTFSTCKSETKEVMNKQLTLVDTPGLLNTEGSEEDLKSEIIRSITECDPGPHAFLIVLKVERYTEYEEEVITRICQYFTEEVLKYSVIVFNHGDDLDEGTTIHQFVDQNEKLKDLVTKCDDRCHVFDSKHWKNNDLKELLITVDKLVISNNGDIYTIEILQTVDQMKQKEEEVIRERAKHQTRNCSGATLMVCGAGTLMGAVLGASVGFGAAFGAVVGGLLGHYFCCDYGYAFSFS